MALRAARDALSRFFPQRCFRLFLMLLALIAIAPFLPATTQGRVVFRCRAQSCDDDRPASQRVPAGSGPVELYDALYFSMTVLTSAGFGDIAPITRRAQAICIVEQVTGALFVAIVFARLAGVYPPRRCEAA